MLAMSLPVMSKPPLAFTRASKAWERGVEHAADQPRFRTLAVKPVMGSPADFAGGTHARTRVTDDGKLELAPVVAADENFEAYAIGATPSTNWTVSQPGSSTVQVQHTGGLGRAMRIADPVAGDNPSATLTFKARIAKGSLELKMKAEQTTGFFGIILSDGTNGLSFYIASDGTFKYRQLDAAGAFVTDAALTTPTSYAANTVYDLRFEWDFSAGTNSGISVYVNGVLKGSALNSVVTNYFKSVDRVQFNVNAGNVGTVWYDQIKAYSRLGCMFDRGSVANNPYDGSQRASYLPRYARGKNLLDKNQSDWETNTTGFQYNNLGTTATRDTTEFWQGAASLKVVCDGTGAGQGIYVTSPFTGRQPGFVPAGSTVTGSYYVKGTSTGQLVITVYVLYTDGTQSVNTLSYSVTSSWTRVSASVTSTAGKTIDRVRMTATTSGTQVATYYIDGLQVEIGAAATAWVQGGDHAVLFEEGTTNIMAAGRENPSTWSVDAGVTNTVTSGQADPFGGTSAYRVQTTGGANSYKIFSAIASPSGAGTKYSQQVWIKNNNANAMTVQNNLGGSVTVNQSDGWKLVKIENTTGDGATSYNMRFHALNAADNLDIYIMWPQAEAKAYCTSYVAPGSTRSTEIAALGQGLVTPSTGAIVCRAYVDGDLRVADPARFHYLFSHRLASTGADDVSIYWYNGAWFAQLKNSAGTTTNITWYNVLPVGWHTFAITWSASRLSLWVDGVEQQFTTTGINLPQATQQLYVGGRGDTNFPWNFPVDWIAVYDTVPSNGTMATLTAAAAVVPTDAIYAVDFAGTLDFAATAEWTSDWYDTLAPASPVVTYGGTESRVQSAPTGTTCSQEFSTANLDTKSDASAFNSNLGALTGRFPRLKVKFTKAASTASFPSFTQIVPSVVDQGKALVIEEGASNLLSLNQSNVDTDLTGFSTIGVASIFRDLSLSLEGVACVKVITQGGAIGQGVNVSNGIAATAGLNYTVSAYVRGVGTIRPVMLHMNSGAYVTQTNGGNVTLTNTWQRISVTGTLNAGANQVILQLSTPTDQAITFWADCFQVEQKGYATSWLPGGQTRAGEVVTLTNAVASAAAGKIRSKFLLDHVTSASVNVIQTIIDVAGTGTTGAILLTDPATQKLRMVVGDGASVLGVSALASLAPNTWYTCEGRWDADDRSLILDGAAEVSLAAGTAVSLANPGIYLGCNNSNIRFLDGLMQWAEVEDAGGQLFRVDFANGGFDYKRVAA